MAAAGSSSGGCDRLSLWLGVCMVVDDDAWIGEPFTGSLLARHQFRDWGTGHHILSRTHSRDPIGSIVGMKPAFLSNAEADWPGMLCAAGMHTHTKPLRIAADETFFAFFTSSYMVATGAAQAASYIRSDAAETRQTRSQHDVLFVLGQLRAWRSWFELAPVDFKRSKGTRLKTPTLSTWRRKTCDSTA
jgi:hypothetical protein